MWSAFKGSNSTWAEMFRVLGYDQAHIVELWLKERAAWNGAAESDAVFISQKGGQLDRSQIFRLFVQVCEEAGIPKELRHPHVLRHSFGFISRQQGCELEVTQMGLGHKSIASTGIYTQGIPRKRRIKNLKRLSRGCVEAMLNLKQAAGKVGISEGLLILWVSTGKFTPSIESSLKSTNFTGIAARALEILRRSGRRGS